MFSCDWSSDVCSSDLFPTFDGSYLVESNFEYPISINGKVRKTISFSVDMPTPEIEKSVLLDETIQKWLEGKTPKKIIVVPKRIINVVI